MPSLYAHHSFGKEIYKKLPEDLKQIIRKYPNAFNAGLQGPDFLFFYRPFIKCGPNKLGRSQHSQPFCDFLERVRPVIRKKGKDCGEYAYLLGFICHFMLDSESHTYVNKKAKEPGYNHLVMEIEFDRYLMKKDGRNPLLYPAWKHITWTKIHWMQFTGSMAFLSFQGKRSKSLCDPCPLSNGFLPREELSAGYLSVLVCSYPATIKNWRDI